METRLKTALLLFLVVTLNNFELIAQDLDTKLGNTRKKISVNDVNKNTKKRYDLNTLKQNSKKSIILLESDLYLAYLKYESIKNKKKNSSKSAKNKSFNTSTGYNGIIKEELTKSCNGKDIPISNPCWELDKDLQQKFVIEDAPIVRPCPKGINDHCFPNPRFLRSRVNFLTFPRFEKVLNIEITDLNGKKIGKVGKSKVNHLKHYISYPLEMNFKSKDIYVRIKKINSKGKLIAYKIPLRFK